MNISQKIKTYLKETGRTQKFLCKKAGLKPSAVSLTLGGKRQLRLDEYCKICKALAVDPSFFL